MRTLFLLFGFSFSCLAQVATQPPQGSVNVKALVDSIDRALFRTYIFPEKSKLMGNHLKSQLKKGAYKSIGDPKELAGRLEQDMQSVHHDGHLRVNYDPDFARMLSQPSLPKPVGVDSMALRSERAENFGFKKAEILNGNIGYVQFSGFSGMIQEAKATIGAALAFLSNTDAIIIDLRKNGGGSPHMVKHVYSYFVSTRTRLNDIYDRRVDKTMEFWAEPADAESMKLSMPVYILTSKQTFSAAEDFTYAMQVNKRAVIVGDSTGGGAHPTGPVSVGQNFVVDIPFARSINHITKTDWEGTGVIPDIPVSEEKALVKAQDLILHARLSTAKTEIEKHRAKWLIDALKATDYDDVTIDTTLLKTYEGEYGRFKVFVKDNVLFLYDFTGRTFRLKPIEKNHFLGDDWLQVEFISGDGQVSQMRMSGKPGWVDTMNKN
ncbi:MAG TPA: S41 family peptidase [Chryseolinea sp.]|nr:S41 family peptidase [Chryseolinea sp.]